MIKQEDVYQIGRMGKAHGLKGEINLQFTDDVWDRAESDHIICLVDGILVPFFLEEYRFRSDTTAILKLEDIDSLDAVQMLVNSPVFIEKHYQDTLDDDDISLHYFIGFQMLNADDGQPIGTITDIDDQTDNWLFIVRRPDDTEALIPAHEEFIADIKKEEKTMLMDLPLGLLDL